MSKTDAKWHDRIRQWKESGKTAEEFAVGQPFKASTLKWRGAELRRSEKGGKRYGKGSGVDGSVRFAQVVPVPRARARAEALSVGVGVVVEVSGARITVSRGFDAELLAEVVRALESKR